MRELGSAEAVMCCVALVVEKVAMRHGVTTSFMPDESFVDGGLTSVGMVELMLAIEEAFNVGVPDSELNATNFSSIASLSALVFRLNAGRTRAGPAAIGATEPQPFKALASQR